MLICTTPNILLILFPLFLVFNFLQILCIYQRLTDGTTIILIISYDIIFVCTPVRSLIDIVIVTVLLSC